MNSSDLKYASIPKRLGAVCIDTIIIFLMTIILGLLLVYLIPTPSSYSQEMNEIANQGIFIVTAIIIDITYTITMMYSKKCGTYGMNVMNIMIVNVNGSKANLVTLFIRYFSSYISSIIFKLGYAIALFTPKKQTLHDLFARTVVIEIDTFNQSISDKNENTKKSFSHLENYWNSLNLVGKLCIIFIAILVIISVVAW
jgi:uncharacterized RDD family membrane protein YckC